MAEAITEMIIPGTYIEVRAEGLIGVSGIATGNVGIVGTASKGPIDEAVILSSFAEAKEIFGDYDGWVDGSSDELTLVRALQQVFGNGGSTVYAVRTAHTGVSEASKTLIDGTGDVVTIKAKTKGTWGHDITVQAKAASENATVEARSQDVTASPLQPLHANIASSASNSVKVTKGDSGKLTRLAIKTTGSPVKGRSVSVDTSTGIMTFHADDVPEEGDALVATYQVDKSACREIEIKYGALKEIYSVVDADDLKGDINRESILVEAEIASGAGPRLPDVMDAALQLVGGSNGSNANASDYETTLEKLDSEPVNIVTLAGQTFTDGSAALLAHVEKAENNSHDRIAVIGADSSTVSEVVANADSVGDDRLILVAPGIRGTDLTLGTTADIGTGYASAAISGLLASLAVQVSPTNKVLRISGLSELYNDGELKKLINNRVMVLEKKAGYRVVKGITSDTGAFKQVSVRRIVDYAKAGVRIGSLPYIGKLNNSRVRAALKATLNGFLSDMVLNEALTDFTLDVTATREQEIAGIALVTLHLKPTFSIDYIKVIMNLA